MISLPRLENIISHVQHGAFIFSTGMMGGGNFLKVRFEDGNLKVHHGRKWYVSTYATESEVVQTALKAVLTVVEHEARETFTYMGRAIFGPHLNVRSLLGLVDAKELEVRS